MSPSDLGFEAEQEILEIYNDLLNSVRDAANDDDIEMCLSRTADLWMFMNRFRNCDLGIYFNEEIHVLIQQLNKKRFDTSGLLHDKNSFRIAFILTGLVDTGGASVPHRFMLESGKVGDWTFEPYVFVTNIRDRDDHRDTDSYAYLREHYNLGDFVYLDPGMTWQEKGEKLQSWLFDNKIDFVVAAPCPATIFALASNPVPIKAILSQDCYCFTVGPGVGDVTFLVTADQVMKYKFQTRRPEDHLKIVTLPLHSDQYIDSSKEMDISHLKLPKDAVVSGCTNLWKSCFGDCEILLDSISSLVRKHPNYHHVFAGTSRCLDNLEFFLEKNPDIKSNIHFIGEVKNIYRLLKSIDFWVNSYPTSGGSDIEAARVGKPTIEFIFNRNLTLHSPEFLRSRECEVTSIEEFIALGEKFITQHSYRQNLGLYLQSKVRREFDKNVLVAEKIYKSLVQEFHHKRNSGPAKKLADPGAAIAYEKAIGLYNSYGCKNWPARRRWSWLQKCVHEYPDKPFGWIKLFEHAILENDKCRFLEISSKLPDNLLRDHRISLMMGLCFKKFDDIGMAIKTVKTSAEASKYDPLPSKFYLKFLCCAGRQKEAQKFYDNLKLEDKCFSRDFSIETYIRSIDTIALPIYYEY